MAFDRGPNSLGVLRMQSAAERIYRAGELLGRVPKDFSETVGVKDGVRQDVPVPEAVGGACEGQKISLFTAAQWIFLPAVSRPLYQQHDYQQECNDAKCNETDNMPLIKRQK